MGLSVLASIYAGTNSEELVHCLESLALQTLPADEIVIVLDGPVTPSVEQCLGRYSARLPIRLVPFSENRGLGPALRDGLLECSHELIARVDTDDRSVLVRFETQVHFLEQFPTVSIVGGMIREHWYHGSRKAQYVRSMPLSHQQICRTARRRNPINHPTVAFRKNDILACGNYGDYPFFEDYELWARVISNGYLLRNIDQVLVETTTNQAFFSRRGGLSYIHDEFFLARRLYQLGFLNSFQLTRFILTRVPVRLTPSPLMEFFYRTVLRTEEKAPD